MKRRPFIALIAAAVLPAAFAAQPLQLQVYNPGAKAIFPVSSVLVSGAREAILIDAQFQRNSAEELVRLIKESGKTLTTVYISHSDPDFYFGLETVQAAFPAARIVATSHTVKAIKGNMDKKLAHWGPIMKDNAPKTLVVPEVLKGERLVLEGQAIEIKGLRGASPQRSYVWIASLKTVAGGVLVFSGAHVWMADTQTPASRKQWQTTLDQIAALKPELVVPGHFLGVQPKGLSAVSYTKQYIAAFEEEAAKAKDGAALASAMQARFPQAGLPAALDTSSKVMKGEMKWGQ